MDKPNEEKKVVTCLNCGTLCESNYCPKCGQNTSTKRLEYKEMISSTVTSIIGGDNKLLCTIKSLLLRPGHAVREYLLGKRASYYKPVSMLVFLVAIYAIASYFISEAVDPFKILQPEKDKGEITSESADLFITYLQAITSNKVYFALLSVIMSLLPYRFIFRKQALVRLEGDALPLNITEHFIALVYQSCFNMILALMLLPLGTFEEGVTLSARICFVMPTIYCIILYKQMLQLSWTISIWMNIKALFLSFCINISLLLLMIGILYGFDNTFE